MSRRVRVDEQAARELEEAAVWYEREAPGTGARLVSAFADAVDVLREEPFPLSTCPGEAGRLGAKRLLLHRFPFELVVVEQAEELFIVAVAHQSRRPGYWLDRLKT